MRRTPYRALALAALAALAFGPLSACQNLPGTREQQSTVIGGAVGAAAGAALNEENRLMGALIGGALGAGGGYLIGARTDWFERDTVSRRAEARDAIERARRDPATVDDVYASSTADLNADGFVTIDELVAMERAGLSDDAILGRLRATGQVFDLSESQRRELVSAGVSNRVVNEMEWINRDRREQILGQR